MLKLIKAETMYNKAAVIVTDFVESMPEETNSDAATILRSCEQIAEVSCSQKIIKGSIAMYNSQFNWC